MTDAHSRLLPESELRLAAARLLVANRLIARGDAAEVANGIEFQRLSGGANNAVFRAVAGGQTFLVKQFYHQATDTHDRFAAETAFAALAANLKTKRTPRLLAASAASRVAIYEFVNGLPFAPHDITPQTVQQAAAFLGELSACRDTPEAAALPMAAEACFSISEHLACVGERVRRLRSIAGNANIEREALQFVESKILPAWEQTRQAIGRRCADEAFDSDQTLAPCERCISPSDFGFHNAMLLAPDRVMFFDFEYAGWDDPAKLACDFSCQLEVPVAEHLLPPFVQAVCAASAHAAQTAQRIALLAPLYRLKWCCIALNVFLPAGKARREFSCAHLQAARNLESQLGKAETLLQKMP